MIREMNSRSRNILTAVIESFIKTGSPISSGWLYEKYNFGIKPAMIRHELENLTGEGYLEQPYHSAGRVPSDRAYEVFVNQILETDSEPDPSDIFVNALRHSNWPEFLTNFSSQLGILGALEDGSEERIYKTGLENLLDRMNWENTESIKSIVRDFEELDQKIEGLKKKMTEETTQVFIGRKSPVTESEDLAVIAQNCFCDGENFFLLAIGPKRMNYKKVVKTFKDLENINERRK